MKLNCVLQEENEEHILVNRYLEPIREIFRLMDVKQEGVVSRVDLVKLIRNNAVKTKSKSKIYIYIYIYIYNYFL